MSESETSFHGQERDLSDGLKMRTAIMDAVDYRGDVTITMANGDERDVFIFAADLDVDEPFIEVFPAVDNSARERIEVSSLKRLVFSGRDTADGKSWEAWLKRHEEGQRSQ